jgi:hypothetical protein
MLTEGNQIRYTVFYCVNFCDSILITVPFPLRSVIKLRFRYGKKVTVPTVPVPEHWFFSQQTYR